MDELGVLLILLIYVSPALKKHWLVPDNTEHKGTSKHHKTDEKSTLLWCLFLNQYSIQTNILSYYTQIPLNFALGWLKNINVDREMCTAVLSVFWFGSGPKQNYLLLELSYFLFSCYTLVTNAPEFGILLYISLINIIESRHLFSTFTKLLLLFSHKDPI